MSDDLSPPSTSTPRPDPGDLGLGLFDIMQVDPLRAGSIGEMFDERLAHLALADELGFDISFVAERHFLASFACPSATAWVAAASQRTARMRLGVMAYTLPIHAPVQLAEDIAILDQLSGGRLEAGFGLGHRIDEFTALGADASGRITSFQERLALIQALWTGGAVTYGRGGFNLRDVAISPTPVQLPHPPLWFAGTDATAASWAGANGLSLAVGFKPDADLAPTVEEYRSSGPTGRVALMRAVVVGERDEDICDEVAGHLVRLQGLTGGQGSATAAEQWVAAREQVEVMIANDVMIAGSVETVAAGIRRAQERLGFDLLLANVYALGASDAQIRRSLHLLAGPVRALLAGRITAA